jgi:hypothetical protein
MKGNCHPCHPSPDAALHARRAGTLEHRIEAFFHAHRGKLTVVHGVMFVVFIAMIFGPLALPEPPSGATAFSHLTPFANYVLWGVWFPLVFLSVLVSGRAWCGLFCPMGAAAEWGNRLGPQLAVPRWLRWEGMPVASFLIVTVLGQTVGVRDHAEAAAEVFGGTMLAAIVVGFLFGRRRRAWCRHLCPIGLLLGIFSRLGAVEFRPAQRLPGGESYTEKGACPMMIDLARKEESRHCIECFRCVNPDAKGGLHMVLRRPGQEVERIRDHHANPVEVLFLFLGTGIALGGFLWGAMPMFQELRQMVGEWAIDTGWLWLTQPGPGWLMSVHPERREMLLWLDFLLIVGFMLAVMAAMASLLALTTAAAAWAAGRLGADADFRRRYTELGYQVAPVAMVSLVVGLGYALFEPLRYTSLGAEGIAAAKGVLFVLGLAWSLWLGIRILARQGVPTGRLWLALLPGFAGSLLVALAWGRAIFGF